MFFCQPATANSVCMASLQCFQNITFIIITFFIY